jgi:nicotinate-nucleotide pyrophosphorylase (carboxylating)
MSDRLALEEIIERALREDVRSGDVTSQAVVPDGALGRAVLVAREPLTCCALDVAQAVFERIDPLVRVLALAREGEHVEAGTLATVEGPLRSLLTAERTALNLLQRACGIATMTRRCVDVASPYGVQVLDTRKTAPGLRALDRRAVRAGGGTNHRHALDDMILVKDNHVAAAGGLAAAVERALAWPARLQVEVEVDSLEMLEELLSLPRQPHAVLVDNFAPQDVATAVTLVAGRMYVEVSGGVTLTTLRDFAQARPDGISLGALTHSVKACDIALDMTGAA